MLNKVAKSWVAALRSKKYKQGTGQLRRGKNKYCCLGVLTELAIKNKIVSEKTVEWDDGGLSDPVRKWVGLGSSMGCYFHSVTDEKTDLTLDNDGHTKTSYQEKQKSKSFKQIAEIIESKPKGLFRKGK